MSESDMELIKEIRSKTTSFAKTINFPVENNQVFHLVKSKIINESEALNFFKTTRPVVHLKVLNLFEHFLELKKAHGSKVERAFYQSFTSSDLITRLFRDRAVAFVGASDRFLLRDGSTGFGGFESIGSDNEKPPLILTNYLSYDEMKLSSLIGLSSPTVFINDGDRNNCGRPMEPGKYESRGVIVGLVGCRFERIGFMEYRDLVAHQSQNLAENGFGDDETQALSAGASKQSTELNKLWSSFYDVPLFPTFSTAANNPNYISCSQGYFNVTAYLKRVQITAETLLLEANSRASEIGQKSYVYVVGLGLGVWALDGFKAQLQQMYIDGFGKALCHLQLSHVDTVAFSWIKGDLSKITPKNPNLKVCLTQRNPCAKFEPVDQGKLLVVTYAWDGNAFPGNEYWYGFLSGSGDPAAASCSLISELQNPVINPFISGQHAKIIDPDRDDF